MLAWVAITEEAAPGSASERAAESAAAAGPAQEATAPERSGSRTPPIGRIARVPNSSFRQLPGVWDATGRLNPEDWAVDNIQVDGAGNLTCRFISRTPEGDASAGPPRLRVLSITETLVDAAIAVRLRPGSVVGPR